MSPLHLRHISAVSYSAVLYNKTHIERKKNEILDEGVYVHNRI